MPKCPQCFHVHYRRTDMDNTLYSVNVSVFGDEKLFCEIYSQMPQERKDKIDRLKFGKDKYLSLGAGFLLEYVKRQYGITSPVKTTKYGKPYFENCNLHFNLSHSGSRALCAVSEHNIGCDIELVTKYNKRLAKRFFTENEFEYLQSLSPQDQDRLFFTIWCRKESYMKAVGLGLALSPERIETVDDNGSLKNSIFSEKNYFFFGPASPDYGLACCIEENNDAPCFIPLNPKIRK